MAQGLITLLSLCLVMAGASFLAGILPLSLNLSAARLRIVSTIGMGVLVGTSLIVIIPEGVDTLYNSSPTSSVHTTRNEIAPRLPSVNWQYTTYSNVASLEQRKELALDEIISPGPVIPSADMIPSKTPVEPGKIGILEAQDGQDGPHVDHDEDAHHAWIGIALVSGFIVMFIIDKLPQYTTAAKPQSHTRHISLTNLGRRFHLTTLDREDEADTFLETARPPSEPSNRAFATTIGLVIHAAADGIALGASSSASNHSLSFIIFFAIMIHKAPAAFGLTSVLLKQGCSKRTARTHLIIFSMAAPAGAFLTFLLANIVSGRGATGSMQSSQWWTGILLLFSAGTFLYVAMHSMQEVMGSHHNRDQQANGNANGSIHEGRDSASTEPSPSISDLGAACFGMILPIFLQIGHAH